MKITPRCTGWIPNAAAIGAISGTTTNVAEKMSISAADREQEQVQREQEHVFVPHVKSAPLDEQRREAAHPRSRR